MIYSSRKTRCSFSLLVAVGLAASLSACVVVQAPGSVPEASQVVISAPPSQEESSSSPPTSEPPVTPVPAAESVVEWSDVIDEARTGVVHLNVSNCEGPAGSGSGFLIEGGLVVTAAHVIKDASKIFLLIGDQLVTGQVLGTNDLSDIALVRVNTDVVGHHFDFIEGEPRIGTEVRALGFPHYISVEDAEASRNGFTANGGDVTALNQTVKYAFGTIEDMIRTDASIDSGNSGGPLITKDGSVVGLVSAVRMTTDGAPVNGWAYAVTAPRIVEAVTEWQERGTSVTLTSCDNANAPDDLTLQVNVVSSHDQATSIAQSLASHGQAINIGNYDSAYSIFTGRVLKKVGSLENWAEGVGTSYWLGLRVDDVQGTGDQLRTRIQLATAQDAEHSPKGTTGQECSLWTLDYTMDWDGTRWLMENVQTVGVPQDCTDQSGD